MLRDMRGGGVEGSPHRFRLMQILLNAVALLAITGALFAYFRANPAVQVEVLTTHLLTCTPTATTTMNPELGSFLNDVKK